MIWAGVERVPPRHMALWRYVLGDAQIVYFCQTTQTRQIDGRSVALATPLYIEMHGPA